ncbi:hypothetical protein LZQ00_10215 [Sphingobacterium sp. SRCM116780]|uniref:hypothetical protein n=1 Tax=Sphingobacterium sp. SRCM116780 TaxID=2907623 RepID=UPI001F376439|nr:hypothetical protein [Sphingobacterium sp. SRCM116780]UIR54649.1 hypothetical protein LZQ00_10215 [Sphingobacterium sp. SRCM116780]
MKKSFDNAGVASLQQEFLFLSAVNQQVWIDAVRTDFPQFMLDKFNLQTTQITLINSMPTTFQDMLANGIADTWESGQAVSFQKDAAAVDKDTKDIIVSDPTPTAAESDSLPFPFSIWIRYRTTL